MDQKTQEILEKAAPRTFSGRRCTHSPIYRIWIHAFLEMVFIPTIYMSLSKPWQQNEGSNTHSEQTSVDIVMYSFVLNYIINDVIEIVRRTYHEPKKSSDLVAGPFP